ncbi:MAG: rhomboid family intramembrane serine protease [Lentisphaeria bacterium]|nr:rhomboid family intramembrane serine protease [Lentisphaeria bacterium]
MILFPYETEVVCDRVPLANHAITMGIAAVFLLQASRAQPEVVRGLVLDGWHPAGMLGYMWLHGGILHICGNLLFLRLFGNATCARMGNLRYLSLYLLSGVFGAALHNVLSGGPAVGASAAINGVVGMYLVFYPQAPVNCWYWVLFVRGGSGSFRVQSYWMILLWLLFDIWGAATGGDGVAYWAHIGGFLTGFAGAFLLVRLGWVTMARYETSLVELLGARPRAKTRR